MDTGAAEGEGPTLAEQGIVETDLAASKAPASTSEMSQDPRTGSRTDADDSLLQILSHDAPAIGTSTDDLAQVVGPLPGTGEYVDSSPNLSGVQIDEMIAAIRRGEAVLDPKTGEQLVALSQEHAIRYLEGLRAPNSTSEGDADSVESAPEQELDSNPPQADSTEAIDAQSGTATSELSRKPKPESRKELKLYVDERFKEARGLVREHRAGGTFDSDPNLAARADMGIATEQVVNGQNPENLKALMQSLDFLLQSARREVAAAQTQAQASPDDVQAKSRLTAAQGEAVRTANLYIDLGQNVSVLNKGRLYLLSNLVIESNSSGSQSTAAQAIIEGEYEIDYDFNRSVLNNEVNNKVAEFERSVVRLRGRPEAQAYQERLDLLRLAQQSRGEAGGVIAVRALEMLNDKSLNEGVLALHGEAVVARSRAAIEAQCRRANISEADTQAIWRLARAGDFEALAKVKDLQKSGLDKAFFGENPEAVVKKLMGPGGFERFGKKYGKSGLMALLLMMASGVMAFQNALRSS